MNQEYDQSFPRKYNPKMDKISKVNMAMAMRRLEIL